LGRLDPKGLPQILGLHPLVPFEAMGELAFPLH